MTACCTCCRQLLDEKARNRLLEAAVADVAVYEVEVKTGKMKVRDGILSCVHAQSMNVHETARPVVMQDGADFNHVVGPD